MRLIVMIIWKNGPIDCELEIVYNLFSFASVFAFFVTTLSTLKFTLNVVINPLPKLYKD